MSWQHPFVLFLAPLAVVAVWCLFRRGSGRCAVQRFPNIAQLWADRHGLSAAPQRVQRRARGLALAFAAALTLLALARPQWGEIAEPRYHRGREVMLALDLSRSMLTDDVSPSRLSRAKLLIDALLDQLKGERVGLTVFAGTAFVQSPLSADYEVLRDLLPSLDPSYLPQGGTDYAAMLRAATDAFGEQGDGDRYLVVLSDGEAHDTEWKSALPALEQRGIKVIGLGIGTPQGGLVPADGGGVMKDAQGNAVLSKLEPATLQELASATGGTYRDAATWVDIADLVNGTVAQGRQGAYVEQQHVRLQDSFQWFLAPALLLFVLSYWLEFPVFPLTRALAARGRRPQQAASTATATALVGLLAWCAPHQAQAAVADQPPPRSAAAASQPPDLAATIDALSSKASLTPTDYARLATDTIGFAAQPSAPKGAARDGVIDDALAAVTRGEAADAKAADWPALRQQLEALRKVAEPPAQKKQQHQKSDKNEGESSADNKDDAGQQSQDDQQNGKQSDSKAGDSQADKQSGEQQQPQDGQQSGGDSAQAKSDASQSKDSASSPQRGGKQTEQPSADQLAKSGSDSDSKNDTDKHDAQPSSAASDEHDQRESTDSASAQRDGADETKAPEKDPDKTAGGAVARRDDVKPLDAAGLGDDKQDKASRDAQPAQPKAEAPQPQPATRMVGGGRPQADDSDAEATGDVAMADALGRMRAVKEGDSPAVLFDRMNRAEGHAQRPTNGQDW